MLPSGCLRTLLLNPLHLPHSSSISFCSCSTARRFACTLQKAIRIHVKKRLNSAIPDGCCFCTLQLIHFFVADNLAMNGGEKEHSTLVEELNELMTHKLCPFLTHNRTYYRTTTIHIHFTSERSQILGNEDVVLHNARLFRIIRILL